ncbi:NUDIX domain protein [Caprobacter fermentans]|uniref:NUDIX domain protein n=2 Tax=Caproicibacter fermentans TaxID=2576756 RepID=A0A6N8I2F3_9FIRM|nr:NUDIX domain protein [Caproicibacter fermentans]
MKMKTDTVVRFYETVDPSLLKYAVIVARSGGKWVLCRHRDRHTWEVPGGHREPGEEITQAARRELYEETGAARFSLSPVCVYGVSGSINHGTENFGMLFFAEIEDFGPLPPFEIAETALRDEFPAPDCLTYPDIQPQLFRRVLRQIKEG